MGKFRALWERGFESECRAYASGSALQFSDFWSGKKEARGGNSARQVDDDSGGGRNGKAGKLGLWSLSGTIAYLGGIDCRNDEYGETVFREAIDTKH